MKRFFIRAVSIILVSVMAISILASCEAEFEEFSGDLRERYNYDLSEYIDEGDYKELEIYVGSGEPTKSQIDAQIFEWRVLYTATIKPWESVGEGVASEMGDIVDVRYQGYIDGEKLKDMAHSPYKEEGFSMSLGSEMLFEGVDKNLVGLKIGDKKTFDVTVPDPCFEYPYYVGKTITFEVEITDIRSAELAPYDNELAEYYGSHNIEGFESYVVSELKRQQNEKLEDYVLDRVMHEIIDNFEVKKYPEKELDEIFKSMKAADEAAAKEASLSFEEYVKKNFSMTVEEYEKELKDYSEEYVHMEMVLYYIARKEKIALTSAVFDEEATLLAQENNMSTPAEYMSYMAASGYSEYSVREMIWFELVYDFIYENTIQKTEK